MTNTAFPDLRGKQWAKAVPPVPHGLMADIDAALTQEIFDLSQRQGVANIRHDCEADDLRRTVEITKGIVHHQRLRGRTSRLKPIYSDNARLRTRVRDYFDPDVSHEEIARRYPGVMKSTARFDARATRGALIARGGPDEAGFVRFAYRPFDTRWLYWERDTKLLDEKRADYRPHVFEGNLWLVFQNKARPDLSPPLAISNLGDLNQMNSGVYCVLALLSDDGLEVAEDQKQHRPNLSRTAQSYLERLDADALDLVHH